jgi:hypothetical protein
MYVGEGEGKATVANSGMGEILVRGDGSPGAAQNIQPKQFPAFIPDPLATLAVAPMSQCRKAIHWGTCFFASSCVLADAGGVGWKPLYIYYICDRSWTFRKEREGGNDEGVGQVEGRQRTRSPRAEQILVDPLNRDRDYPSQ